MTDVTEFESRLRPAPIKERCRDRPLNGQLAVQIFASDGDGPSETEWVHSTRWLDPVAKR